MFKSSSKSANGLFCGCIKGSSETFTLQSEGLSALGHDLQLAVGVGWGWVSTGHWVGIGFGGNNEMKVNTSHSMAEAADSMTVR